MVQDFGWTKEIEDRLLAPVPTRLIAAEKIVAGVIQGVIAAAFVLPIARLVMGPIPALTLSHAGEVLLIVLLGSTGVLVARHVARHRDRAAADRSDVQRHHRADVVLRMRVLSVARTRRRARDEVPRADQSDGLRRRRNARRADAERAAHAARRRRRRAASSSRRCSGRSACGASTSARSDERSSPSDDPIDALSGAARRGEAHSARRASRADRVRARHRRRRRASRACASSCSRTSTSADSSSTRTTRAGKGRELLATHRAAMCFHWQPLEVQVRVEGRGRGRERRRGGRVLRVARARKPDRRVGVDPEPPDERARAISTRASPRSRARFAGEPVPRPPHWSGFRVVPRAIEFWKGMPSRLHVRARLQRVRDDGWSVELLYP